jgi:hypothetical protein
MLECARICSHISFLHTTQSLFLLLFVFSSHQTFMTYRIVARIKRHIICCIAALATVSALSYTKTGTHARTHARTHTHTHTEAIYSHFNTSVNLIKIIAWRFLIDKNSLYGLREVFAFVEGVKVCNRRMQGELRDLSRFRDRAKRVRFLTGTGAI